MLHFNAIKTKQLFKFQNLDQNHEEIEGHNSYMSAQWQLWNIFKYFVSLFVFI